MFYLYPTRKYNENDVAKLAIPTSAFHVVFSCLTLPTLYSLLTLSYILISP